MARRKDKRPGYDKLLDAWIPPENSGDPVGCVATSFTFSPVFFEEECLGRFLQLETDPTEDGVLYLIEREEKLAQVACAAALVDQHHCQGARSLRWDLLPARMPKGILHSKISILRWSELVRVVIASANLTEDGYRRNQEVFGVLDYRAGGEAPRDALESVVEFLRAAVRYAHSEAEASPPAVQRWNEFLDGVLAIPDEWTAESRTQRRGSIRVMPVLTGPDRADALERLASIWPPRVPPIHASVVSPFFDPPATDNAPAKALWQRLRQRGEANVAFYVSAEEIPGEHALFVHAPESLGRAQPRGRHEVTTEFVRIKLDANRPLHAKSIWLEGDRWVVYMIGSSNFTSAGLGIGHVKNLEANLAYIIDARANPKSYDRARERHLDGDKIDPDSELRWQPREDDAEDSAPETVLLPPAFGSATYDSDTKQQTTMRLTFAGAPPPGWRVRTDGEEATVMAESDWQSKGSPAEVVQAWSSDRPPSGFWVSWTESGGSAWWPVNVANAASLPPPQELKNLPLDVLVDILTSARPLHRAMEKHLLRMARAGDGSGDGPLIDPHKRVDTSGFLLQRTRRVAWALNALRERLERPVVTEECLCWRLHGPVGVIALAEALVREAASPEESAFLLSELALELHRAVPRDATGCVPAEVVRHEIRRVVDDLRSRVPHVADADLANLKHYVDDVFERISR